MKRFSFPANALFVCWKNFGFFSTNKKCICWKAKSLQWRPPWRCRPFSATQPRSADRDPVGPGHPSGRPGSPPRFGRGGPTLSPPGTASRASRPCKGGPRCSLRGSPRALRAPTGPGAHAVPFGDSLGASRPCRPGRTLFPSGTLRALARDHAVPSGNTGPSRASRPRTGSRCPLRGHPRALRALAGEQRTRCSRSARSAPSQANSEHAVPCGNSFARSARFGHLSEHIFGIGASPRFPRPCFS